MSDSDSGCTSQNNQENVTGSYMVAASFSSSQGGADFDDTQESHTYTPPSADAATAMNSTNASTELPATSAQSSNPSPARRAWFAQWLLRCSRSRK